MKIFYPIRKELMLSTKKMWIKPSEPIWMQVMFIYTIAAKSKQKIFRLCCRHFKFRKILLPQIKNLFGSKISKWNPCHFKESGRETNHRNCSFSAGFSAFWIGTSARRQLFNINAYAIRQSKTGLWAISRLLQFERNQLWSATWHRVNYISNQMFQGIARIRAWFAFWNHF